MTKIWSQAGCLALILSGFASVSHAQTPSQDAVNDLGGTSWQLAKFQAGDGGVLTPDDAAKYAISFDRNGGVNVRVDCNRGNGSWSSAGKNEVQFGPMALTRAMCPQSALNDRFVKDWEHVRSYTMKDGHLFLALMADGGTYEYDPVTQSGAAGGGTAKSPLQDLPATFAGTMPCADCPGIRYRLELKQDHSFTSSMTYEDRNASFEDVGTWELANDGGVLVLHGGHNSTSKFKLVDADTLRQLDGDGNEIQSKLNYELKRSKTSAASEGAGASGSLERTHWKLAVLGETPVGSGSETKEAYFELDPSSHRVSGSGGCNRLMGSYQLDGSQLKFGKMAGTMMMCPQGMDTERDFLQALSNTSTWKISQGRLDLIGSTGKVLAGFVAANSNQLKRKGLEPHGSSCDEGGVRICPDCPANVAAGGVAGL